MISQSTKKETVSIVFRKGEKLVESTDFICCNGERPKTSTLFRYLAVTPANRQDLKQKAKERASALRAMHELENLRLLFLDLEAAMKLYAEKIIPILTYGLEQILDHLTENDLAILGNVKATYLKRALYLGSQRPGLHML
jgi:hypothetical protein